MSDEHKVMCYFCHREFRPVLSQIKLVCNDCYEEESDKAQAIGYRKGLIKGRELQKQEDVSEVLKDLNRAYKKGSLGLCWSEVKKNIEKWEGKKND